MSPGPNVSRGTPDAVRSGRFPPWRAGGALAPPARARHDRSVSRERTATPEGARAPRRRTMGLGDGVGGGILRPEISGESSPPQPFPDDWVPEPAIRKGVAAAQRLRGGEGTRIRGSGGPRGGLGARPARFAAGIPSAQSRRRSLERLLGSKYIILGVPFRDAKDFFFAWIRSCGHGFEPHIG